MAIERDGKIYRNLQEQVGYLTDQLADVHAGVASFGVIADGPYDEFPEVMEADKYYIVKSGDYYHLYDSEKHDLGQVQGEKGDKGDKGDTGETGHIGPQGVRGTGIKSLSNSDITTIISGSDIFTDNTISVLLDNGETTTFKVRAVGTKGEHGTNGASINGIATGQPTPEESGTYTYTKQIVTVTMSDGRTIDFPVWAYAKNGSADQKWTLTNGILTPIDDVDTVQIKKLTVLDAEGLTCTSPSINGVAGCSAVNSPATLSLTGTTGAELKAGSTYQSGITITPSEESADKGTVKVNCDLNVTGTLTANDSVSLNGANVFLNATPDNANVLPNYPLFRNTNGRVVKVPQISIYGDTTDPTLENKAKVSQIGDITSSGSNTFSGANNFTGTLQKNGVDVATVEDKPDLSDYLKRTDLIAGDNIIIDAGNTVTKVLEAPSTTDQSLYTEYKLPDLINGILGTTDYTEWESWTAEWTCSGNISTAKNKKFNLWTDGTTNKLAQGTYSISYTKGSEYATLAYGSGTLKLYMTVDPSAFLVCLENDSFKLTSSQIKSDQMKISAGVPPTLVAGNNITLTEDSSANTITIASSASSAGVYANFFDGTTYISTILNLAKEKIGTVHGLLLFGTDMELITTSGSTAAFSNISRIEITGTSSASLSTLSTLALDITYASGYQGTTSKSYYRNTFSKTYLRVKTSNCISVLAF